MPLNLFEKPVLCFGILNKRVKFLKGTEYPYSKFAPTGGGDVRRNFKMGGGAFPVTPALFSLQLIAYKYMLITDW